MSLLARRKDTIRKFFEQVISEGRYELSESIFAEEFLWEQFGLCGPEGANQWARGFRAAFPDVRDKVVQQIAEGDTIVSILKITGTHQGGYMGVEPTGRRAVWHAVGVDRFSGEKVIARSAHFDVTALMLQLGVDKLPILPSSSLPNPSLPVLNGVRT